MRLGWTPLRDREAGKSDVREGTTGIRRAPDRALLRRVRAHLAPAPADSRDTRPILTDPETDLLHIRRDLLRVRRDSPHVRRAVQRPAGRPAHSRGCVANSQRLPARAEKTSARMQ